MLHAACRGLKEGISYHAEEEEEEEEETEDDRRP